MPYRLSNLDFVTESLTLIAGNSSVPALASSYSRCTPVVVSSVTPASPAAMSVQRRGAAAREARSVSRMTRHSWLSDSVGIRHRPRGLELAALVHQQGGVAAVVQDQVGAALGAPVEDLRGAPPVLLEALALPGEHRHPGRGVDGAGRADRDGRGGLILGGEDVAAGPAHPGAEGDEGLDEHGGLHGHVQGAGDARAGERLGGGELLAQRHQAGHLVLGQAQLVASGRGEREVGDFEGQGGRHGSHPPILAAC